MERLSRRRAKAAMATARRLLLTVAFTLFLLLACASRAAAQQRRANFVFIFADDLGYGDLGRYGAQLIRTPNIDRMAREGILFTDFYSCSALCTPARAGFLTGRYPVRVGVTRVIHPRHNTGIPAHEITLAEALKSAGYATACIGKWHLGHRPQFLPTRHGFDRYYGIPYSNDMKPTPLVRGEEVIEEPADQTTLTQRYTAEAVRFINESKDGPFFLYLAHTFPHVPLYCSPAFRGTSPRGLYGDVVQELDWSTGRVLAEIRRLGLDDDTIVVFTSDNGPWLQKGSHGGSAGILRGGKGTIFEGGIRVPCIVRWPGRIKRGRIERRPATMLDWFPTFVNLAGGKLPGDRVIDGRDIGKVLLGSDRRADEEFFFYFNEELQAYRSGQWKLKLPFAGNWWDRKPHPQFLFDMARDPAEKRDVGRGHRDVADRMLKQIEVFKEQPDLYRAGK